LNPGIDAQAFAAALIEWQAQHGRHDLPWQQEKTAYRVWVSEIMLQQTQVNTVIPYYQRFMQRFPDLPTLAHADQDVVLEHWAGLGYYARARNLHRCAKLCVELHQSDLPQDFTALQQLPGIGRSTAAAILSFSDAQPLAILDGNVKRVLSRLACIDGWPGQSAVLKQLWQLSESLTPLRRTAVFNQAMMDLGAAVCTRTRPRCESCPVYSFCTAGQQQSWAQYPGKKPNTGARRKQQVYMRVELLEAGILLEKRPPTGIWGGLWSLPQFESRESLHSEVDEVFAELDSLEHAFSHFDLLIKPLFRDLRGQVCSNRVNDAAQTCWKPGANLGLATPVKKIVEQVYRDYVTVSF